MKQDPRCTRSPGAQRVHSTSTQDWFGPYTSAAAVDPQGAPTGDRRVTRGGCYYCDAVHERAARRNRDVEDHSSRSIGFRIVAVLRK